MNQFCAMQGCLEAFLVSPELLCWRFLTHISGQVDGPTGIVHGQRIIERNSLHVTIPLQCSNVHNAESCQEFSKSFCRACFRDHGVTQGFCEEHLVRVCEICLGERFCFTCAEPQNHRCVCGIVTSGPGAELSPSRTCNRAVAFIL